MSDQHPNAETTNGAASTAADRSKEANHANGAEKRAIRRGPHPGYLLLGLVLIVVALWAGVAFHESIRDGASAVRGKVIAAFSESAPAGEGARGGVQYYQAPMHSWIISPEPGQCPVCGMNLVPIDPEALTGEVSIDPRVVQNMGVRVEAVTQGPLTRTVSTVGIVDYDETQVRDVNIKVKGWIEDLHVDSTGEQVRQGEPLFDIYSPALYAAQEELLLAQNGSSTESGSPLPGGTNGPMSLLGSARTRLLFYGITKKQINALLERGNPEKAVTIHSPHEGTVVEKHATDGMRVTPGMRVYRIADLSQVWVMATVYEYQLPYVHEGQQAMMTLAYLPGETFEGEVDYIYPYLDQSTREVQVRLVFDNPNGRLKPGMFANMKLQSTIDQQAVLAPREAVIDTGERQVALVSTGGGTFEPRDVTLGPTTGDNQVQVLDGLKPGENVVTSGQFLIDSEAKMRASLAKMVKGQQARAEPASTRQAEPTGDVREPATRPATQPSR